MSHSLSLLDAGTIVVLESDVGCKKQCSQKHVVTML